jgi:hypothetical protein
LTNPYKVGLHGAFDWNRAAECPKVHDRTMVTGTQRPYGNVGVLHRKRRMSHT